MSNFISLNRQFSLITPDESDGDSLENYLNMRVGDIVNWAALEKEYRVVILAEAGAGI